MSTLVRHHDRLVAMHGKLVKFPDFCFTFNIDTTKGNGFSSFQLPFTSNAVTNCYVDFGDNSGWIHITSYNQAETLHPYSAGGVYTIKIKGEVSWSFNNTGDCQKITHISKWGNTKFNYVFAGFYGCINLVSIPADSGPVVPSAKTLALMFFECKKLVYRPVGVFFKNTPLVENINSIWQDCFMLTGDISEDLFWYLPNLKYANASLYRTAISGMLKEKQFFYNPNLISVNQIIYNCYNMSGTIPDRLFINNINIESMSGLFRLVNVSGIFPSDFFDYTPNLKNTSYLLYGTKSLIITQFNIPLSVIPNITDFSYMMYNTVSSDKFTGTVQDIWTYASPTANKLNCFTGQTLLTNYNDIPNEWKGL